MATSKPYMWRNVGVHVETARGQEITVTGISNTAVAEVTYSGNVDPQDGDLIHFTECSGVSRIQHRVFRVSALDTQAKTFELKGEDTTKRGAFISGKFAIVTLGASFKTVQNVSPSGGEPTDIPNTTIHDDQENNLNGPPSALSVAFTNFFAIDDAGLQEYEKAEAADELRVQRFSYPDGAEWLMVGYPFVNQLPSGDAQARMMTAASMKVRGRVKFYPPAP